MDIRWDKLVGKKVTQIKEDNVGLKDEAVRVIFDDDTILRIETQTNKVEMLNR